MASAAVTNQSDKSKEDTMMLDSADDSDNMSSPPASEVLDLEEAEMRASSAGLSGKKGKASVTGADDDEVEEEVEEYDFDDAPSHISIPSSSSPEPSEHGLDDRPWLSMSRRQRQHYEWMYYNVTDFPIGDSWQNTEDYQREKDKEMLLYLEDFPVVNWMIHPEEAKLAYLRLLERSRWRALGVPIYGSQRRMQEWIPNATFPMGMPPPQLPIRQQGPPPPPQQMAQHGQQQRRQQAQHPHRAGPPHVQPSHQERPQTTTGGPPPPPRSHVLRSQPIFDGKEVGNGQPSSYAQRPVLQSQHMHTAPEKPDPAAAPSQHPDMAPPHMGLPRPAPAGSSNQQVPSPYAPMPAPPPEPKQKSVPSRAKQGAANVSGRKPRVRKPTPPPASPPPPPETPPYAPRQRTDVEPKKKSKNKNILGQRLPAEADDFPWHRDLDFEEVKKNATWDDSNYDSARLVEMAECRARNEPIIAEIDRKLQESQKESRKRSKEQNKPDDDGENVESVAPKKGRKGRKPKAVQEKIEGGSGVDPYHNGAFSFADEENINRAKELGFVGSTGGKDAREAFDEGRITIEQATKLMICWNPGRKGTAQNLEQAWFSVKDSVLTEQQLKRTPILTWRAAECIVDFAPHLLWRGMLLRIASETGFGNKDIRDRFCLNGCYCDKATPTKRISAALGQKQGANQDQDWYEANCIDFGKYIQYFGKRTNVRNFLKSLRVARMAAIKRARTASEESEREDGEDGSAGEDRPKVKRIKRSPPEGDKVTPASGAGPLFGSIPELTETEEVEEGSG